MGRVIVETRAHKQKRGACVCVRVLCERDKEGQSKRGKDKRKKRNPQDKNRQLESKTKRALAGACVPVQRVGPKPDHSRDDRERRKERKAQHRRGAATTTTERTKEPKRQHDTTPVARSLAGSVAFVYFINDIYGPASRLARVLHYTTFLYRHSSRQINDGAQRATTTTNI